MRVFVTGATGTIGLAVSTAFRRAGHQVWGLARRAEKASALARAEIHPVLGDLGSPESFAAVAESCSVLVHAAAEYGSGAFAFERSAVHALLAAARKRGPQPKTLIYTSGTWVYGNTGDRLVDETAPVAPAPHVSERPAVERLVLEAEGVRAVVLRPGCVYGHQGSLTAMWFEAARGGGTLEVIGDGSARWALVHLDDLGRAYVRAAESGLSGVFNVTDRSRSSVREMAIAVARVTGHAGGIRTTPVADAARSMGTLAECLALDQNVDSRKAVRLLGWQPGHGGFVDEVDECFEAWKAWNPR
jgi:nucleoside-diphosphate-sugar epimerase